MTIIAPDIHKLSRSCRKHEDGDGGGKYNDDDDEDNGDDEDGLTFQPANCFQSMMG